MSIYGWFVVILVTSIAVMLGVGWLMERGQRQLDRLVERGQRQLDRLVLLDQLDQVTDKLLDRANDDMLPRAGYLPGPQYREPPMPPIPWDLAGAAYALGQQRAEQDAVSREVEAIFAEVESNPERWQG